VLCFPLTSSAWFARFIKVLVFNCSVSVPSLVLIVCNASVLGAYYTIVCLPFYHILWAVFVYLGALNVQLPRTCLFHLDKVLSALFLFAGTEVLCGCIFLEDRRA